LKINLAIRTMPGVHGSSGQDRRLPVLPNPVFTLANRGDAMAMHTRRKALEKKLQSLGDQKAELLEKVDLLNELSELVVSEHPGRALQLSREALEIAEKTGYQKGIARSVGHIGFAHYMLSDLEKALRNLDKAKTLAEDLGDAGLRGQALALLGMVHRSLGDFDKALSVAFAAQKIIDKSDKPAWRAAICNVIGGCYHDVGDFERALAYHQQAWEAYQQLNDAEQAQTVAGARALNGIGTVYQSMAKYGKAREYLEACRALFEKMQDKLGQSRALNDLANIFSQQGDLETALAYNLKSLEIREKIGNKQAISTSLINLGRIHVVHKDYQRALQKLHRALNLAMEIRAKPRIWQAHLELSRVYEEIGDFANALAHHQLFHQAQAEVTGDEANAKIKNLQIRLEVEKSEREAEISRLKNIELKEKNKRLKSLLKELQKTQSQLVQTEKMASLGTLVAGIAHEMNTPVGTIKSSADVIARCIKVILETLATSTTVDDLKNSKPFNTALKALQVDNQNSTLAIDRITRIVNSLRGFIQLDQAAFQKVDLHAGLDNTLTLLEHVLNHRIEVVKAYGDIPRITAFASELNQAFMSLLSNAIAAIPETGRITITTSSQDGQVLVEISDTGVGIARERMKKLFEPMFTRKGTRIKAGLGLFTSYNIIQKHHGDIRVDSEVGRGSTFTISLPVDLEKGA
jgi:signal transduction histidine kinase